MLKELIGDVSVLTFFLAFVVPFMILIQLFVPDVYPWKYVTYALPFLFGLSSSYVINKGHDSEFLERTFITSLVVSVFLFIILYQSFSMINKMLLQIQQQFTQVPTSQLPSFLQGLFKLKSENIIFQLLIQSLMIVAGAMVDAGIKTIRKR